MTKKVALALSIFSAFLYSELSAQAVYFTGLGRALVTNDKLGDFTRQDSRLKASSGYTLFDLGIYAKPNEVLRGGVILRTRNEFGGFFGEGSSLEFRQMQLEGLIAKKVKYEIGDVYLTHTPYTLWNEDGIFGNNKYEAGIFSMRRDIVYYENFFVGNAWRMQGVNASGKINFKKGIESLGIRAYGGRTRETDFVTIPDRYFYGGRLDLTQSKYFRIAGNLAGISDIAGTVEAADVNYNNMVYTTDFAFTLDKSEKFKFVLSGEAGVSKFDLKRDIDTVKNSFEDFFYDAGIKATYKPWNFSIGASYRDVGYNFNSPMAQTRRIVGPLQTLTNFPTLNDSLTARQSSLFDAYMQEPVQGKAFYNQGISTVLMPYLPLYDLVEPYGKATPNRKGFTVTADIQTPNELIKAGIEANLLTEGVSEGDSVTQEKRKFIRIRGGLVLNVNKLIGFEKLIAISGGVRTEQSSRVGTNPVEVNTSLLDLGLDVEVLKDLHLLGGTKFFTAKGYEVIAVRDELNQIAGFLSTTLNETQNIIAAGVRYDYDKAGYFSMHYHTADFIDSASGAYKYKMNQLFFVFGLKF